MDTQKETRTVSVTISIKGETNDSAPPFVMDLDVPSSDLSDHTSKEIIQAHAQFVRDVYASSTFHFHPGKELRIVLDVPCHCTTSEKHENGAN